VSFDNNGDLNVGGTVNWYYRGTSNPAPAYNENDVEIIQPFTIGTDGRVNFKLANTFGYRIVVKDNLGSTILDRDDVYSSSSIVTSGDDFKVMATSGDTMPGFLDSKLVAGSNIVLSAVSTSAGDYIEISSGGGEATSGSAGAGTLQTCHLANANGVVDFGGDSTQYPRYSYVVTSNDAFAIDKMKVYAYSVTGSVDYEFGLYQVSGSNIEKLISKTETISSTGLQEVSFNTSLDLTAGVSYYVGAIRQTTSGSCQLAMESSLGTDAISFQGAGITTPFALPSTESTKTPINYNIWSMLYSSTGGSSSSSQWTSVAVTNNYNAERNNIVLCDTTAGDITVTLPLAGINTNREIVINKISSDSNLVTVACQGPDLLNGLASRDLEYQYTSISVISDGTNWWIR
jgi:hypothetical protein